MCDVVDYVVKEHEFHELLLIRKQSFKVVDSRFFIFCVDIIILYLSGDQPHAYNILVSIIIPACPRASGATLDNKR